MNTRMFRTTGLRDQGAWRNIAADMNWKEWLTEPDDALELSRVRLNTHMGRALATDGFLSKVERILSRRQRPQPVGGPRKAKTGSQKHVIVLYSPYSPRLPLRGRARHAGLSVACCK